MSLPLTTQIANWAIPAWDEATDGPLADIVRQHLIDTVAVAIPGSVTEVTSIIRDTFFLTNEAGSTSFSNREFALLLGTASHAYDFDSIHNPSLVHASCVIVPTALAVSRGLPISDLRILGAIAVGQEVALAMGEAAIPSGGANSELFERGFHPTGICGPIGAAVTAGLILGLNPVQLAEAIGISCSLASGILEGNRTGGLVKPVHAGLAAQNGILAAQLAANGMTSPPTALEGRFGFFYAFMGPNTGIDEWPAKSWRVRAMGIKPYPTNGFTHAAIDAALRMRTEGITPEMISTITVGVPGPTLRTIAEPVADKARPKNEYTARFSGPFTFALALTGGGGLGIAIEDVNDEIIQDPNLLSLIDRITFVSDPEFTAIFPDAMGARATVVMTTGETRVFEVSNRRGSPAHALSTEEIAIKFRASVRSTIGDAETESLYAGLSAFGQGSESFADTVRSAFEKCIRQAPSI